MTSPNEFQTPTGPMRRKPTAFQRGYVDCALWCGLDDDAPKDHYGLSDDGRDKLLSDAQAFDDANRALLDAANAAGRDDEFLGHDFWLSRNAHGTGFWDRGLGAIGDALHKAAKAAGSCDLHVNDDGEIDAT